MNRKSLQQTSIFVIGSLIVLVFLFRNCNEHYERVANCHLDKMHLNGNVIKIESIVQSTIPLTELYANAFDPRSGVTSYGGNMTIEFDLHGNVKQSTGYGMDGSILFQSNFDTSESSMDFMPSVLIGPTAQQTINSISTTCAPNGDIVRVKYFDNHNELVWDQKAEYNDNGSPRSITKEYAQLSSLNDFFSIQYADTTLYTYLDYDSLGNWTEAEVFYKGVLPKHQHSYKIKRQITYWNDSQKPALISTLGEYNRGQMSSTDVFDVISLGRYGHMKIPRYMALRSENHIKEVKKYTANYVDMASQMNYLFMSEYNDKDAYATISAVLTPDDGSNSYDDLSAEELRYDEEIDKFFEEQNTLMMAQGGIYILKWLPYQFVTLSGKRALKYRYYRYGNGSPIPVYCENYTIPMSDGNVLSIIFSMQSNLYNRFYADFTTSIQSVRFQ